MELPLLLIPSLFALSVGGLAYVVSQAISAGAQAYSGAYSEDTAREFEDVFLFIPPKRIAEAGWAACATTFILVFLIIGSLTTKHGFVIGLILGAVAAALALQSPRFLLNLLKRRRLRKFDLQLVDTLVSMSNALKAGFSITQAFESVAKEGENPIAQEFDVFLQQTRIGVTFSEALENMDKRVGSADLTLVVQAIEAARKTGGNLTEVFEKISATIRERMRIESRIRTLTAQGRLQGIIVSLMPIIIGVALMIVDPEMTAPFFQSAAGFFVIITVGILITLGGLLIRKIINIDV
jgi:tight adherence protein B